jgi:YidC/Oxa1 family membrane protein insertase
VATVSNVGGVLKSFRLKDYPDNNGKPVEMIDTRAATTGLPLAIESGDKARDAAMAVALFQVKRDGPKLALEWAENGLRVQRDYVFDADTYTFSIGSKVTQNGVVTPHRVVWTGFGDSEVSTTGIFCWLGLASCDETARTAVIDVTPPAAPGAPNATAVFETALAPDPKDKTEIKGPVLERTARRAGLQDQYFVLMFGLKDPAAFHVTKHIVPGATQGPSSFVGISVPVEPSPTRVYAGPKHREALEKADSGLGEIVDYGMFWFITEPLAKALMWIHGYVGNFGWAIILLTCAINFALFPLRLKQQLSMQKLQKLQPQMKTLQDKFKKLKPGDPRRNEIQAQIMNLYKENGVNPLGGCFPLLLQLPFLYAVLQVLSITIELRRAPWIFWINDLSQQDPYYVMPILMALSMVVMQKMTPTTMDPAQARMMMIMPIMMVFLFLTSPSGLMLYWLTGNLIGMGQQVFINKYWTPESAQVTKRKGRTEVSA